MYISKLIIKNFKKFQNVEFDFNEHFNLIIGSNNAGKSTMMEALRLWQLAFSKFSKDRTHNQASSFRTVQYFSTTLDEIQFLRVNDFKNLFYKKDTTKKILISVFLTENTTTIELPISFTLSTQKMYLRFELCSSPDARKETGNELLKLINKPKGTSLKSTLLISYLSPLFSLTNKEILYSSGYILNLIQQAKSDEVLRNLLNKYAPLYYKTKKNQFLTEEMKEIESDLQYILNPNEKDVNLQFFSNFKENKDKYLEIIARDNQKNTDIELNQLGSGTLNLLNILAVLAYGDYEKFDLSVLLLDEPDSHLHADYQKRLFEVLSRKANEKNKQMFVITHNHELIEASEEVLYVGSGKKINSNIKKEEYYLIYKSIAPEYYRKMIEIADIKEGINSLNKQIQNIKKPLIITEGKTDWKHLKRALSIFQENDEYKNLDIDFFEYDSNVEMGNSQLMNFISSLSNIPQPKKIIAVFDSDDNKINKFVDSFINKNNVYVFSIKDFYNVNSNNGISIEFLYKRDDILSVTKDGRRLYINDEFNSRPPHCHKMNDALFCYESNKLSKKSLVIIDNNVFDKEGKNHALTKSDFADRVLNKCPELNKLEQFAGFKHIFDYLQKIIR